MPDDSGDRDLPLPEVTRLLGARHRYAPELGGWVPEVSASLETSVPGLFVAGIPAHSRPGADTLAGVSRDAAVIARTIADRP